LDLVSTESGRPQAEVPSFGDLFDDPEPTGEIPVATSGAPAEDEHSAYDGVSASTGEVRAVVQEHRDEPDVPVSPAGVAGFEHAEESDDEPAVSASPAGAAGFDHHDEPDVPVSPAGVAGFEHADEPDDERAAFVPVSAPAAIEVPAAVREPERMDVVPRVVATAAPAVTGRLYRSSGAEGPHTEDAIPAIDPDYLAARDAERGAAAAADAPAKPARDAAVQGGSGLTWSGVVVVVILGTVLVAFADALINNSLGILTGIALLVSSVYCALLVRPADIWAAAIVPPLAFLAAALTAGQLTLDNPGSLVVREGYMLLKTLAQNAPWIVGTTLICFAIVIVRRRRAAHA
jgi:hypothetical protein